MDDDIEKLFGEGASAEPATRRQIAEAVQKVLDDLPGAVTTHWVLAIERTNDRGQRFDTICPVESAVWRDLGLVEAARAEVQAWVGSVIARSYDTDEDED